MLKKPVFLNIILICSICLLWIIYTYPDSVNILEKNWPVTLTMVFGSFIAGATSEGGGAIAFPVFTKALHIQPEEARVFSLAIQSVGMMAATFTIILLRIAVEWRFIFWASLGGILGVVVSSLYFSGYFPPALLKMLFTAMITSFAITLMIVNWQYRNYNHTLPALNLPEIAILMISGFIGGCMTGLVGNGIDIICFSVMILLFRLSEKISTPTSVILMAINALAGFIINLYWLDTFTAPIKEWWLSAIPVVIIGAPLGAFFCTKLNNKTIASVLIGLIMIELSSSLILIPLTQEIVLISGGVFLFFSAIYYRLARIRRYQPEFRGTTS